VIIVEGVAGMDVIMGVRCVKAMIMGRC